MGIILAFCILFYNTAVLFVVFMFILALLHILLLISHLGNLNGVVSWGNKNDDSPADYFLSFL